MAPAWTMQVCAAKGEGGVGTQTWPPVQPPPTLAGKHAFAVSDHCEGGRLLIRLGVQLPFSGMAGVTRADSAPLQAEPTQNPVVSYGNAALPQLPTHPADE